MIVFVSCGSKKEARSIARRLLAKREIACANIIDNVTSFFRWKGRIDTSRESMLIIKTMKSCVRRVEREIKRMHSYEVPEIIALPIGSGSREYLAWIGESCRKTKR